MGIFYNSEMLPENFWRKLWHRREPFSSLIHYVSQFNIIASFSPRRCVHFILCHYLIYVGNKRHFPSFSAWDTHSRKFPWAGVYITSHLGLALAPFLFCCSVGDILIQLYNLYPILQIRKWHGHSDCTNLSPCTDIFSLVNAIFLSSYLVITSWYKRNVKFVTRKMTLWPIEGSSGRLNQVFYKIEINVILYSD